MADPSNLGRYQLRRVLGKGAMGVVYEGFDPNLNRPVAVKTILKSVVTDEETAAAYSARFVREAKAVARLNHPNIVQVYDFGEENDIGYLVMEFIQGRELRSCFEAGESFVLVEVVRIMGELLEALEFAHEAGVIHRDIKPANVMLDVQRHVKLADFGVARLQDGNDRSKGGTMVGTPAFMSPEQISGRKVDRRSDLFSAGIILYQLLTGEQPFKGAGAWTVVKQIMQDEPPRPSTIAGNVSSVFDQIVNKALAKRPEDRFASANDFRESLQGALSVVPVRRGSEAEIEFWRTIQASTDPAEYEVYLKEFPTGVYAELARVKIAKLPSVESRALEIADSPSPPSARASEDVSKLSDETAKLQAALDQREAEYRKREAEAAALQAAEAKARAEADARHDADVRVHAIAAEKSRLEAVEKARKEAQAELARKEAEYQRRVTDARAKAEAEAKARVEADLVVAKARKEVEEKARMLADEFARAKVDADIRAKKELEERSKREAASARRQAELTRRLAEASRAKEPVVPIAIAIVLVASIAGGGWYMYMRGHQDRLAALTVALDVATKASQELDQARQRQEELLRRLEMFRLAEYDARAKGDAAKLKELQEQTRKAEAEVQKQRELIKQREAESQRVEKATKDGNARNLADAKSADKGAQEKASQEKVAQTRAVELAAAEKAAAEKAASEKLAATPPQNSSIPAVPKSATPSVSAEELLKQGIAAQAAGKNAEAARLFRQASRGSGQAAGDSAQRLADMLAKGVDGVPRDSGESLRYAEIARKNGVSIAVDNAQRRTRIVTHGY